MKKIIFLSLVVIFGCDQSKVKMETPSEPSQVVALPVFENPAAFDKLIEAQPVVDSIYKVYAEQNHFPSIVYGIVANGKLVFSGGHGYSNIDKKITPTASTVYRIASMSKSFTAMAILKLRDEGKLHITDPVSNYIPEFKNAGALTTDAAPITIQNLMTMSAGFPEDNPWGDRQLDDSNEELMELVQAGLSFSNVPGINYEYSNLGYALLGRTISNVSGMPYQQYITENILKPLGMNNSFYEFENVGDDKLALGYLWENDQWIAEPILHDGAYGAMGGMLCSLEDFSKYVAFQLDAWPPRNDPETGPIKRSSIREMHQPWRFNNLFTNAKDRHGNLCPIAVGYGYGLGWRKDCNGVVRISHSGGLPGYGSEWRFYPEYGVGVVAFSNERYGAPSGANALVLDTLISIAGLQPRNLAPSAILQIRRKQITKFITHQFSDTSFFAENFFLDQSQDDRMKEIDQLFADAGRFVRIGQSKSLNQLRMEFVIEFENKNVTVFFTLTPEKNPLVQQLDVWETED